MPRKKHGTKKFIQYYGIKYVEEVKRLKRDKEAARARQESWFEPCPICGKTTKPYFGKTNKDGFMILAYRCNPCEKQWHVKKINVFDAGRSFPLS